ncbi:MAG: CHAD domain-containing protein [Actinobacteria bacterium]|nr:CHAD domain-containing protein [Actinomycetota bacterium]
MARTKTTDGIKPDDVLTVAAARIVDSRAQDMFELRDAVLNADDVEAVHDMRVASRRLRAVLEMFERCFDRKPLRRVLRDVGSLTRALGSRRDLDVQIELLTPLAAQAAAADRVGIEALIATRVELRRQAQELIPGALATIDDRRFADDLARIVATPAPKRYKGGKLKRVDPSASIRDNARLMLDGRARKLSKLADGAVASGETAELHATRIAAKRLRYAIHAVEFCFEDRLAQIHAQSRTIQNILGELHDCDVIGGVIDDSIEAARGEDAAAIAPTAPPGPDRLAWNALRSAPHRNEYLGLTKLSVLLAARREAARQQFSDYWQPLSSGALCDALHSATRQNGK